jgi:hypothetical protein
MDAGLDDLFFAVRQGRAARAGILVLMLTVTGLPAACGTARPPAASPRPTPQTPAPPATSPPTTASPAATGASRAPVALRALLLTKKDLPPGWKAETHNFTPLSPSPLIGRPRTVTKVLPMAMSPDFMRFGATVSSTAASSDSLRASITELTSPGFAQQFRNGYQQLNPPKAGEYQEVTVTRLQVTPYGRFSIGYRLHVTMSSPGGYPSDSYEDVVWLLSDHYEIAIYFDDAPWPFAAALRKRIIAKLGARLEAAG